MVAVLQEKAPQIVKKMTKQILVGQHNWRKMGARVRVGEKSTMRKGKVGL